MGWQDRDYNREEGGGTFGQRLSGRSVVMWLLIINVIIFLLDAIFTGSRRASALSLSELGYFSVEKGIFEFQVWRWLTYQFLHAGLLHIFFNMLALFYFGPMLENWWGSRRFLAFYLLCGVGGALLVTILAPVPGLLGMTRATGLVGASGCIFGLLVGAAIIAPRQTVMLMFPPIPMQMKTLAMVFLGIAVLSVIVGSGNAGGEAAHLGGAGIGFMLMKFPRTLSFADGLGKMMVNWRVNRLRASALREQTSAAREDAEVDRILAKVKEHGLQSLTDKEKKTLQSATDRQRRSA